jgi:hypothetical protein
LTPAREHVGGSDKSVRGSDGFIRIFPSPSASANGELAFTTGRFRALGEFRSGFGPASAPLAQSVEQRTFNPQVLGSSPRGRTTVSRHSWGTT